MLKQGTTWAVEGIQFTESRPRMTAHCWCGSERYIAYLDHLLLGIDCVTYDWVFGCQSGWYETWYTNNELRACLHYVQIMCILHDYCSSGFWLNTIHFQKDLQLTRQPLDLCSFQFRNLNGLIRPCLLVHLKFEEICMGCLTTTI